LLVVVVESTVQFKPDFAGRYRLSPENISVCTEPEMVAMTERQLRAEGRRNKNKAVSDDGKQSGNGRRGAWR
jgi:hypothetical protein